MLMSYFTRKALLRFPRTTNVLQLLDRTCRFTLQKYLTSPGSPHCAIEGGRLDLVAFDLAYNRVSSRLAVLRRLALAISSAFSDQLLVVLESPETRDLAVSQTSNRLLKTQPHVHKLEHVCQIYSTVPKTISPALVPSLHCTYHATSMRLAILAFLSLVITVALGAPVPKDFQPDEPDTTTPSSQAPASAANLAERLRELANSMRSGPDGEENSRGHLHDQDETDEYQVNIAGPNAVSE